MNKDQFYKDLDHNNSGKRGEQLTKKHMVFYLCGWVKSTLEKNKARLGERVVQRGLVLYFIYFISITIK